MADYYVAVNLTMDQTRIEIQEYEDSERATLTLATEGASAVAIDFMCIEHLEDFVVVLQHAITHHKAAQNQN